jgi:hypothetical protein
MVSRMLPMRNVVCQASIGAVAIVDLAFISHNVTGNIRVKLPRVGGPIVASALADN